MSAYIRVPFSEAVRDATGGNPKVQRKEYLSEGPLPVVDQGQELIAGYTTTDNAYAGQLPVVLFGDHTRTFKYVDFSFALGADGVKVLVPQDGFEAYFLYHFFRNAHIPSAGYSRHFKFLREIPVCKPPIDEQRRIVGILNRAAKIERLRAQAADRLREFIPALFVRMFGDPVENPMGWDAMNLAQLAEEFRYGTSKKCLGESREGDTPILRIPNVLGNAVNWRDIKFTSLTDKEATLLFLEHGDILFVRTNGNPNYIGRCAVFNDNREAAYASYLIRLRLAVDANVIPEFVAACLELPSMRQAILRLARTTAGNYNINIQSLGSLTIPVPSLELQSLYADLIAKARRLASTTECTGAKGSALAAALMTRLLGATE